MNLKNSLRVVIVGCGGFSKNYLSVYKNLPNLQVTLCVDADLATAKAMADMLGANNYSDNFLDAVEAEADYAVLSTPNYLHVSQATALLGSGKHLLMQKPMARYLAEAQELFNFQRALSGPKLGLYMSMLDFGLWWELRQMFSAEQALGKITQVNMRLGHTGGILWNKQAVDLWRFSREKTGGGAFIMLGVHYIHFLRWLLGLRIMRVQAQTKNLHCSKIEGEDICQIQGELENGALFQLSVAWNSQGENFSIYGTEGSMLYFDNEHLRVHALRPCRTKYFDYTTSGKWQNFSNILPPKLDDPDNAFNQHRLFYEAILNDKQPIVEAREGIWDMNVADAVYRSAATGSWQEITYV